MFNNFSWLITKQARGEHAANIYEKSKQLAEIYQLWHEEEPMICDLFIGYMLNIETQRKILRFFSVR